MHVRRVTYPLGFVLAVLAGAVAVASALAAAGCGRTAAGTGAAAGTPVPASAIGRLTVIAHRVAAGNATPPGVDHGRDDHPRQGAHLGHSR